MGNPFKKPWNQGQKQTMTPCNFNQVHQLSWTRILLVSFFAHWALPDLAKQQCPWLAQRRFWKSTSSLSLGPPCCLVRIGFAHNMILQHLPNKATHTAFEIVSESAGKLHPFSSHSRYRSGTETSCARCERCLLTTSLVRSTSNTLAPTFPRIFHTIFDLLNYQLLLNSIFCHQVTLVFFLSNGTLAAQFEYHFWRENGMTLRACTIVNFNTERFKLGKTVFQMVNFITREKKFCFMVTWICI